MPQDDGKHRMHAKLSGAPALVGVGVVLAECIQRVVGANLH
jgi:hypothetical protein